MRHALLPFLLLALASCATPREACITDQTDEMRTLEALIAQDEATLARGYALERQTEYRSGLSLCTGVGRGIGRLGIGTSTCVRPEARVRTVPVAVNLDEVDARLTTLREKRAELSRGVALGVAACREAYPAQ